MPFRMEDKERIIRHSLHLADETKDLQKLLSILNSRDIIIDSEMQTLTKIEDNYARNFNFYKLLVSKDRSGYEILLDALRQTGQHELASLIEGTHVEIEKTKKFIFFTQKSVKKESKMKSTEGSSITDPDVVKEGKKFDASIEKSKENDREDAGEKNEEFDRETDELNNGEDDCQNSTNIDDTKNPEEDIKNEKKKGKKGDEKSQKKKKNEKSGGKLMSKFVPSFFNRGGEVEVQPKEVQRNRLPEMTNKVNLKRLQTSFRHYDESNDGKISVEEFYKLMKTEFDMSQEEALVFLEANDTDDDGEIDYFEFVSMFLPA